ncbi:hypothetical protein D3C87_111610 [compost metagenome]
MSIKNNALIVATCVIGVGLGYSVSSLWSATTNKTPRNPSSAVMGKLQPLKIGKHLAVITTEIVPPAEIPETADQETEIIGRITLQQGIDSDLEYEWNLPSGVTLIEGTLSDGLAEVPVGQTVQLRLNVTGFSKEYQQVISLQAHAIKGGMRFGNSALLTSRPEDTLESIAPQLKEEAEKQLIIPLPVRDASGEQDL